MQQVQKMASDTLIVGFNLDTTTIDREVIPVQQHRTKARHEPVDYVTCLGLGMRFVFRQTGPKHRATGAHYVHWMGRGGHRLQCLFHSLRQSAHGLQTSLVVAQFSVIRQFTVHQQVCDFLEFGDLGKIRDVIATVMQVVSCTAYRTNGRIASSCSR